MNLSVFDVTGREVLIILGEKKTAGKHEIIFDGSGLAAGIYFAQLTSGELSATQKLLLIK